MDIEELNKTQIILLVLLVTFVTSIATGIVTVSLLAQAPPAVTQTVNHIIQRTVETITPTTGDAKPETVKETTVVVKEDDLVTGSIASSFSKVGQVRGGLSTSSPVVALAVVVNGFLVTDSAAIDDEAHLVTFDATSTLATVKARFPEVGIVVLSPERQAVLPTGFRVADTSASKLGQSVIALPSATGSRVGIGAIAARYTLSRLDNAGESVIVRAIDTNITGKITPGAPLINVFGDALGIATSISQGDAGGQGTFVSLSDISPLFLSVKGTSTPATAQ